MTALIYSLILCLLQSVNLAQLSLFSLYLLLSELVNDICELLDTLLLFLHLSLSVLGLSFKHEYFRTVLLSFSDSRNCSGFLLIKHASKLARFGFSALFLLLIELLELLILAVLVDHRVLEPVDLVSQATDLTVCAVQLVTEIV